MEVNSAQPILLLAHHKLQFYYLVNDLHNMSWQFQHPKYLQRASEQKSNAGNALGENARAVGLRDTAKTHMMTATEWIVMEGIAGNPQGPVRTRL